MRETVNPQKSPVTLYYNGTQNFLTEIEHMKNARKAVTDTSQYSRSDKIARKQKIKVEEKSFNLS